MFARKEAHWNWKSPGLAIHEGIAARQGPTGKDLQIGRSMISEYLRSVTAAVTAVTALRVVLVNMSKDVKTCQNK